MLPLRVKAVQPPPGTKRLYAAAGLGFGGLVVLTLATFVVCLGMGRVALAPGRVLAVLLSSVGVGGPVEADFKDLMVYRSALNADEVSAIEAGRVLQASLEIYAPLADADFKPGSAVKNVAQSLTAPKVGPGHVQHVDK